MKHRRKTLATLVLGIAVLGVIVFALPFVDSLRPNDVAKGEVAQVVVVEDLAPGSYKIVSWLGQPVIVVRPSLELVEGLVRLNDRVDGPPIVNTTLPPAFVYVGLSTYRGCELEHMAAGTLGEDWPGGWWDPCHMGAWDYAGRAVTGVNAPPSERLASLPRPKNFELVGSEVRLFR